MKKRLLVIDGSARALVHVRGSLLKEAVFRGHAVYALAELDCLTKEIGEGDVIKALSDIGVVFSGCQLNRASKNPVADIPVILNLYRHIKRCYLSSFFLYGKARKGAELEKMDYLEFIARVTSHIPDKGQVKASDVEGARRILGLYPGLIKTLRRSGDSLDMQDQNMDSFAS